MPRGRRLQESKPNANRENMNLDKRYDKHGETRKPATHCFEQRDNSCKPRKHMQLQRVEKHWKAVKRSYAETTNNDKNMHWQINNNAQHYGFAKSAWCLKIGPATLTKKTKKREKPTTSNVTTRTNERCSKADVWLRQEKASAETARTWTIWASQITAKQQSKRMKSVADYSATQTIQSNKIVRKLKSTMRVMKGATMHIDWTQTITRQILSKTIKCASAV